MFFRRRIFGLVFAGLLFFGLFSLMGRSTYRAGWADGYDSGWIAAVQQAPAAESGETAAPESAAPAAAPRAHYGHGFSPFGWFIGGFFKLLFIFFLLGFIFKLFRWGRWRRHWHRHGGRGHGPWHHGHHGPPWMKGKRGRRCHHDPVDEPEERSEKERYYDEYGPDSPIVDL